MAVLPDGDESKKILDGELKKNEDHKRWKIIKLLGSGGFGDVYKVTKVGGDKEYAMKTEMVIGDKRMLRLKIEVAVLMLCHEQLNPLRKKHFVDFVDRGKTEKFKFLVMGLVGPSLEDIRKMFLVRNYNKSTAMQASMQTLQALWDLHETGDIKPQNFAIGLGEFEKTIYMLDFGIARKFTVGNTKQMKCNILAFDLFDDENGLPWKRAERSKIVDLKEMFFKLQCKHSLSVPKCYRIVPNEFKRIVEYVNELHYAEEPDYVYVTDSLKLISRENKIDLEKKLDWIGKTHKTDREEEFGISEFPTQGIPGTAAQSSVTDIHE
uniref:Protein kinase domain-containing protein n=1 Tax=Heterorhabditis bacteriophora TaxID=37862 RepID=A0A1I7WNA8_HETBA